MSATLRGPQELRRSMRSDIVARVLHHPVGMATRKYLYEARDPTGTAVSGYAEAETFVEARAQLARQGFADVVFVDDDMTAELRACAERAGVEPDEEIDLLTRYKPTALGLALLSLRRNIVWVVVLALLAVGSMRSGQVGWTLALLAGIVAFAAFPAWIQWQQNEIYRRFWDGDYAASERIARRLRSLPVFRKVPTIVAELDGRIAMAKVKQGDLAGALHVIAPWARSDQVPPTFHPVKVNDLHFLARDWGSYLQGMESLLQMTGDADYAKIDMAQVLARVGNDDARAHALLDGIDAAGLSPLHQGFIAWGRGVLHLRAGKDDEALRALVAAVTQMQKMGENPVTWGSLALCTSYLSVAMARCGRREQAAGMFATVRRLAEGHGEDRVLEWLRQEKLLDS